MGTQSASSYVENRLNAGNKMLRIAESCACACKYRIAISMVKCSLENRANIELMLGFGCEFSVSILLV